MGVTLRQPRTNNAVATGWRAASLGPRVLRVETAALAAVARVGKGTRVKPN